DRNDFVGFGAKAHAATTLLEHQGHGFTFVGPDPMSGLDAIAETPCARGFAVGRVVAAQHHRRTDLRGFEGGKHETQSLEGYINGGWRETGGVAQPQAGEREE